MVGMDEKDSYAVAAPVFVYSSGTCYAGFAGCDALRTVFPTVDDWPLMLSIIACYVVRLLFTCLLCATTGAVGFGVQFSADFPQLQLINKVVDFPVVLQRPIFMVQPVWIDVPVVQVVQVSQVVDIPVVPQRLIRHDPGLQLIMRIPQLLFDKVIDVLICQVVQVSHVQAVMVTVVIPQLHLVEKIAVIPDVRMVLVTQTSESLGTARGGVAENCGGTAVAVHRRDGGSLAWCVAGWIV